MRRDPMFRIRRAALVAAAFVALLASNGRGYAADEVGGNAMGHGAMNHDMHGDKAEAKKPKPAPYPLNTCPVKGTKLGAMGKPLAGVYDGREVKFCCPGCANTFEKDQKASLKKLDATIIAKQKPHYPLDTCLVTGQKLGSMGKPIELVFENQLVRLCCKGCVKKLQAKPAGAQKTPNRYMKKLAAAYAAAKKHRSAQVWTCSMHPQIREPGPGKCSVCGMNLIAVASDGGDENEKMKMDPEAHGGAHAGHGN